MIKAWWAEGVDGDGYPKFAVFLGWSAWQGFWGWKIAAPGDSEFLPVNWHVSVAAE